MHWPQGFNQKGTLPHLLTNKLLTSEKKIGEWLQPDENPTFVETWLEMEKLLETGKYMHPFRMIQGLKENEHSFPLNRKSENNWRLQLFDQELGNIVTQGERHPGRKPG